MSYYSINGYWKNDGSTFEDLIVREFDDTPPETDPYSDVDIFFYGLSEENIIEMIAAGQEAGEDFVITSYNKL